MDNTFYNRNIKQQVTVTALEAETLDGEQFIISDDDLIEKYCAAQNETDPYAFEEFISNIISRYDCVFSKALVKEEQA